MTSKTTSWATCCATIKVRTVLPYPDCRATCVATAYSPSALPWLRHLPAVHILRRAWVNQFYVEADRVTWRDRIDLPPASLRFDSPYDPDARFGNKRSTTWSGY